MFHVYWPVAALVAAVVLILIFIALSAGGRICGENLIRTSALPDRATKTYLPESDEDAIFNAVREERESHFAAGSIRSGGMPDPSMEVEMEPQIQFQEQEPVNLSYSNLDASMSPEGRQQFSRY